LFADLARNRLASLQPKESPAPSATVRAISRPEAPETYVFDLDGGTIGGDSTDFWFQADLYLAPRGKALLAVGDRSKRDADGCAAADYSAGRFPLAELPPGSFVCVRTGEGYFGSIAIEGLSERSPRKLALNYVVWGGTAPAAAVVSNCRSRLQLPDRSPGPWRTLARSSKPEQSVRSRTSTPPRQSSRRVSGRIPPQGRRRAGRLYPSRLCRRPGLGRGSDRDRLHRLRQGYRRAQQRPFRNSARRSLVRPQGRRSVAPSKTLAITHGCTARGGVEVDGTTAGRGSSAPSVSEIVVTKLDDVFSANLFRSRLTGALSAVKLAFTPDDVATIAGAAASKWLQLAQGFRYQWELRRRSPGRRGSGTLWRLPLRHRMPQLHAQDLLNGGASRILRSQCDEWRAASSFWMTT
jgi:hypothetical protein